MREVTYNPSRCIPPSKAPVAFDNLVLRPGINYLSDADYDRLAAHPDLETYEDWGAITIADAPITQVPDRVLPVLATYSVEEAKPIIAAESDRAVLEGWLDDPRKTIRQLISDRLGELG